MQQDNKPKPFMDITPPTPSATSRPVITYNPPAPVVEPAVKKININFGDPVTQPPSLPVEPAYQPQPVAVPSPQPQMITPQFTPLTTIQPMSQYGSAPSAVPSVAPLNTLGTPPVAPISPTPPSQAPKFGDLQSKIDAHPLFSGSKEKAPKKKHGFLWDLGWSLAIIMVILAGVYVAIDSGAINASIDLPFHIFPQQTSTIQEI